MNKYKRSILNELIDIPDFTGYKADIEGNIYSMLPQGCRDKFNRAKWNKVPTLLKYRTTKAGYCRVYMRRDSTNMREDVYVHRIIAELFIPNPNNLSDVNHKNSNPMDNRAENLEWLSHKDNLAYGFTKNGYKTRNNLGQFTHK